MAKKGLADAPVQCRRKYAAWIMEVEKHGIEEVRKRSGWNDETLKGQRRGQRSIRLNNQWRAIYEIKGEIIEFISVEEVTPHVY
ncbi:MAG: hypothetical protein V4591_00110 [Bdellovibrionota bacterium]